MDKGTLPYKITIVKSKEKSSDHFLTSALSRLTFQSRPIALITLVQVNDPWNPAREAAELIQGSIEREFNRGTGNSVLMRFENALKVTNTVIERSQEKIDKFIDVAAVLVDGEEVHFSTVGNARVGLRRGKKFSDVSTSNDVTQSRFSAVTSGDVGTKDTLTITTDPLFKKLKEAGENDWDEGPTKILDIISADTEAKTADYLGFILRYSPNEVSQDTYIFFEKEKKPAREFAIPKITLPKKDFKPYFAAIVSSTKKITTQLATILKKIPLKKLVVNRLAYLGLAIIVVAFGIYFVLHRPKTNEQTDKPATILETLNTQSATSVYEFLNQDDNIRQYNELTDEQKLTFANQLGALGISPIKQTTTLAELGDEIVALASFNSNIYLMTTIGQLYRWNGTIMAQITQNSRISEPKDLVVFSDEKIVATDKQGGVWLFDGSNLSPKSLTVPASIAAGGKSIAAYDNNLYILDSTGAVFRFSDFATELTSATTLTKKGVLPFTSVKDWLISGELYALGSNNSFISWTRNALGALKFTPVYVGSQANFLRDNVGNLTIGTDKYIEQYDKTGLLTKIYFLPDKNEIKDILLTSSGQYLAAVGTKLITLSF